MGKDTSLTPYKIICGCDCAYSKDEKIQVCAGVLIKSDNFKIIEYSISKSENPEKYIPGKFYLREGKITIDTIKKIKNKFDLLLINGHGKANVKGIGLASYVGENLKIPTIGIAKELLYGNFSSIGTKRGSMAKVFYNNKVIAYVLRTKDNIKPIFLSEGYKIDLEKIIDLILSISLYKTPEPLRIAHIFSKNFIKKINF